ncbi:MAG: hypothetical protein WC516_06185 [Patescibacteria group bacterium]|jgi:hypothetical protein
MPEIYPELEDILQAINKYSALNPDSMFIFGFVGYKPSGNKDLESGDDILIADETKTHFGGFGELMDVRNLLNDLRDIVEDNCDENDWVNF